MSFASLLGDLTKTLKSDVSGAFNAAQAWVTKETTGEGDSGGSDDFQVLGEKVFMPALSWINDHTLNTDIGQTVMKPMVWSGEQASHAWSASYFQSDIARKHGRNAWTSMLNAEDWREAWDSTDGRDMGVGAVVADVHDNFQQDGFGASTAPEGGIFGDSPESEAMAAREERWKQTTQGRLWAGGVEMAATWYADPTLGVAKVAKISRAANTIKDASHAEEVAQAAKGLDLGEDVSKTAVAGSVFRKDGATTAQRALRTVATTDNMTSRARLAAGLGPMVKRNGQADAVVDIMAQAGGIADLRLQRQVKLNVMLAAAGSSTARRELIEMAPDIARATQRADKAPEEFAMMDEAFKNVDVLSSRGMNLTQAAHAMATTGNEKELVAYGGLLDRLHSRFEQLDEVAAIGGQEVVGRTALDRAKSWSRGKSADFLYQPGVSGRTARVLHWGGGQASKGTISTANPLLGQAELADTLRRTKLFSGAEIQGHVDGYLSLTTQTERGKMIGQLHDIQLAKLARSKGLTAEQLKELTGKLGEYHASGRMYATQQLEKAQADGSKLVTLHDPLSGSAISVDKAMLETHIRDSATLPSLDEMRQAIDDYKKVQTPFKPVNDAISALNGGMNAVNHYWRIGALARPGLLVRTQLDTQPRVISMLGATAYTKQALQALKHVKQSGFNRGQIAEIWATAEDLARRDGMLADDSLSIADELDRRADLIGTGVSADRLRDRAEAARTHARTVGSVSTDLPVRRDLKNALGTEQDVKLGRGRKATTGAYVGIRDRNDIAHALQPGESISSVIMGLDNKISSRFYEDADNYVTVKRDALPDRWNKAYVEATDALVNSPTASIVLRDADHPTLDLVGKLRNDPAVQKEFREVGGGREFDDWISGVVRYTEWHAPTPQLRARLATGKRLESKEIDQFFRPYSKTDDLKGKALERAEAEADEMDELGEFDDGGATDPEDLDPALEQVAPNAGVKRMDLHGAKTSIIGPKDKGLGQDYVTRKASALIGKLSDMPDHMLGRHPLYTGRYFQHFKDLAARELDRTGETFMSHEAQAKIEKISRNRAIQDVHQTLYDTSRRTGAHITMRNLSPFMGAWQDAMESWGRMMYDDPSRAGKLWKVWNAPERMNLVMDEDGNVVKPGDVVKQKFIAVPIPFEFLQGFAGAKEMRFRKDSLNSIFQGEVPWMPGFGPKAQIPANEIIGRAVPELGDSKNPLIQSMFPTGAPKRNGIGSDLFEGLAPGWVKRVHEAFDANSNGSANVYSQSVYSQILDARKAGKPVPSRDTLNETALKATRNVGIIKAISLGIFGMSAEGGNTADFYRDQYNQMREAQDQLPPGVTLEEAFAKAHPEATGLDFRLTRNKTGVSATIKGFDRARTFKKEIERDPEMAWFYIGADNVGGEFSQSVYNAQRSNPMSSTDPSKQRERMDPKDMLDHAVASTGWTEFQQVQTAVDLELKARGLHSIMQTGASDLHDLRKQFIAGLSERNTAWATEFGGSGNVDKINQFMNTVGARALADPKLKKRSDIKALGDYTMVRKAAMEWAEKNGVGSLSSQKAAPVRAILAQYGAGLAEQDIGFMQMWHRMFQREVETEDTEGGTP